MFSLPLEKQCILSPDSLLLGEDGVRMSGAQRGRQQSGSRRQFVDGGVAASMSPFEAAAGETSPKENKWPLTFLSLSLTYV